MYTRGLVSKWHFKSDLSAFKGPFFQELHHKREKESFTPTRHSFVSEWITNEMNNKNCKYPPYFFEHLLKNYSGFFFFCIKSWKHTKCSVSTFCVTCQLWHYDFFKPYQKMDSIILRVDNNGGTEILACYASNL